MSNCENDCEKKMNIQKQTKTKRTEDEYIFVVLWINQRVILSGPRPWSWNFQEIVQNRKGVDVDQPQEKTV